MLKVLALSVHSNLSNLIYALARVLEQSFQATRECNRHQLAIVFSLLAEV